MLIVGTEERQGRVTRNSPRSALAGVAGIKAVAYDRHKHRTGSTARMALGGVVAVVAAVAKNKRRRQWPVLGGGSVMGVGERTAQKSIEADQKGRERAGCAPSLCSQKRAVIIDKVGKMMMLGCCCWCCCCDDGKDTLNHGGLPSFLPALPHEPSKY